MSAGSINNVNKSHTGGKFFCKRTCEDPYIDSEAFSVAYAGDISNLTDRKVRTAKHGEVYLSRFAADTFPYHFEILLLDDHPLFGFFSSKRSLNVGCLRSDADDMIQADRSRGIQLCSEVHEPLRSRAFVDANKCRDLRSVIDEGIAPAEQLVIKIILYFSFYLYEYFRLTVFIKQQPIFRN